MILVTKDVIVNFDNVDAIDVLENGEISAIKNGGRIIFAKYSSYEKAKKVLEMIYMKYIKIARTKQQAVRGLMAMYEDEIFIMPLDEEVEE